MSKSGGNIYYNLLERVSKAMVERGYCLPPQIQGVHHDDTGAVIALVLYFIMKEPKISKKKIKCYLLLLNRICRYKEKGDIVRWERNQHFIQEFIDALIEFMKKKRLICMNGNSKSQLVVYEVPVFFEDILPLMPPNVVFWIDSMLQVCEKKTATAMQNVMLQTNAFNNDVTAVISKCINIIDQHGQSLNN